MEKQREKATIGSNVQLGSVEGVVFVNGRPQIERADMPLGLSFRSIEELERFCEAAKNKDRN